MVNFGYENRPKREPPMNNHIRECSSYQVSVCVAGEAEPHTAYAGAIVVKEAWQQLQVPGLLREAGIRYGKEADLAADISFSLVMGPLVRARSMRKTAQRFGGEADPKGVERDGLLPHLLDQRCSQRQLSRFVNQKRHDWYAFQRQRVRRLQELPDFAPHPKGVLIIDDFPLSKPYAEKMAYLTPIYDSNLKRKVPGYQVVHLYYHHPSRRSYSLHLEPWLKTSASGETQSKPRNARRRVEPGEERSKLDIALEALELYLLQVQPLEVVLFDNWYTAHWFCDALTELELAWIGEASRNHKFQIGCHYLSVPEIYTHFRSRLKRIKGHKKRIRAVAIRAVVRADNSVPHDQPVTLVLVTGLHRSRNDDKPYRLLICNRPNWTSNRIVRLFSHRFRIELVHRHGKQEAGWNAFHTRSLPALLCHLALCLVRSDLLHLMRIGQPSLACLSMLEMLDHVIAGTARLSFDFRRSRLYLHLGTDNPIIHYCRLERTPRSFFRSFVNVLMSFLSGFCYV